MNDYVKTTNTSNGPFVVIVQNTNYNDKDTRVIGLKKHYNTKKEALEFISKFSTYPELKFEIVPIVSEGGFKKYVSW